MSLITSAATTATITATTDVVTRILTFVWDHSAGHVFYLINFEDNHESLTTKTRELKALKDHVKRRVERGEADHLTRTPVVDEWLCSVERTLQEADTILQAGSQQIELRCIADCCLKNWWTCYLLGKKVSKKLAIMDGLISKGNFDIVADESSLIQVEEVPENPTVGMDAFFEEVWSLFRQDDVQIMGLYGMGGVGKTTLLRKIHNSFLQVAENEFDVVIWIVVSKEFSVERAQNEIGENLRLAWSVGDGQNAKKRRIFKELRKRKFVVLLDDLWQHMKLEDIGIPSPKALNNHTSKVVFTTRSEDVCAAMDADRRVKVPVLDWDHAWTLFQQKLHREDLNSRPELQELAKEVAKECGGLPLALVTVARAMSTKETALEWTHAINILKQYASEFSGMKDEVLAPLKFSYDRLENDTLRNCLVYCSLYPEDVDIYKDDLVQHWIWEGFLDKMQNLGETRARGHYIIGSLKAAGLLESSVRIRFIKMHDVVRDMALWIAREDGKRQNKILVQARGSTRAPDIKIWQEAERVSLMFNNFTELPKPPKSPYLLTLLLQDNILSSVTPDFFQYMPVLRVLNLSFTKIREIPQSIGHLAELQVLCLSTTRIEALPEELANLTKLRFLDLRATFFLEKIPRGLIAQLSRLQSLDLYGTRCNCSPIIEEFDSLEDLRELHITIYDFLDQSSLDFSQRLRSCIKGIGIYRCLLTHIQLAPPLLLRYIEGLKKITVSDCTELKELKIDCAKADHNNTELLCTLEELNLRWLPKLNIVWTQGTTAHQYFKNLTAVRITGCDALKEMSWLVLVPFLSTLLIINCKEIEEILVDDVLARASVENHSVLSRLEMMHFTKLPKLQSISRVALPFPSLGSMTINGCPLLKKLPFTSNSTKKSSLRIMGDRKWWNKLEWGDETVETSFQSSFFHRSDNNYF